MKYLFWIFIAGLIIFQAIAYALWRFAFHSPNKTQNDDHAIGDSDQLKPLADKIHHMIDELNSIPYEVVTIVSFDGYILHGRLYVQSPDAPFVICCHGYRGTPTRDFSAGSRIMRAMGLNLLLIEQRSHKSSEGSSITMGVKERKDCIDWINYLSNRFGTDRKIVLCGVSMGAATVLMTAGMNLPSNVKGIIADSPYTKPKDIVLVILKNMKLPPHLCYFFLTIGCWLFGNFNLNDPMADVIDAVRKTKLPILLIHGDSDRFVPFEMSVTLSQENEGMIDFYDFQGAGHGLSCMTDPERYEKITTEYLKRILS